MIMQEPDLKTTMIYTHVTRDSTCGIKSPLTRVRKIQNERQTPMRSDGPALSQAQIPCPPPAAVPPAEPLRAVPPVNPWLIPLRRVGMAALWLAASLVGRRAP